MVEEIDDAFEPNFNEPAQPVQPAQPVDPFQAPVSSVPIGNVGTAAGWVHTIASSVASFSTPQLSEDALKKLREDAEKKNEEAIKAERERIKAEKEKEAADEANPLIITLSKIKPGMHLTLKCKCEGFVQGICREGGLTEQWFTFVYTKPVCSKNKFPLHQKIEQVYAERGSQGMFVETHFSKIFYSVLPATETAAPEWFKSLDQGPRLASHKRCIRLKIMRPEGPINLLIPGYCVDGNVYDAATELRSIVGERCVDIEVGSMDGFENWTASIAKVKAMPPLETLDKNVEALYDWLMVELIMNPEKEFIECEGVCPLPKSEILKVFEKFKAHPLWNGHTIRFTSNDGFVVLLGPQGKIS